MIINNPKTLTELIENLSFEIAEDWLAIRKAKRLPLTSTALKAIEREAFKARLTPAKAIEKSAEEGWCGFKASWLVNASNTQNNNQLRHQNIQNTASYHKEYVEPVESLEDRRKASEQLKKLQSMIKERK